MRRSRLPTGAAIILAGGLGGCLVGDHRSAYQEHRADAQSSQLNARAGEDPGPGSARALPDDTALAESPLALATVRDAVLARSPDLAAALHRWTAALERAPQAAAWPDPFFMYGYSPRRLQTRAGPVRWKTSLSQRIPFPGKRDADEAMALAGAGAARERYAEAGLAVRLWVARAYYDYAYAVRALAINDKSLGLLEEIEKIAQVKYRVGQGSQQDPLKAQVRVIRLKTRAIELQRWRARAESRLNQLLSRPPDAPLGTPPTLASEPQTGPTLAELLEAAYERQPTLQAALEAVRRAEARRSRATLNYLPDVTLGVEYTDIGNANVNYRGEGDGAFAITAGIQLPVSLPARSAAVREAEAEIARAKEELRSVRDGVGQKVRTAFVDTVRAREIERLLRATLIPQARQVLDSARAGYETEKNDFLTLIDAERALDDVEIEAARALADLYSARAELEHAIGGPMGDDDER